MGIKLSKSEKEIQYYIQEERNKRSQELFDKNECELQISEIKLLDEYIYDLANPIWKAIMINGIDTGYQVSNTGCVKNKNDHILSSYKNNSNYLCLKISVNNIKYNYLIHRLVAEIFIPNPENKEQVNHKNGKKTINWVGNLEWNTRKENMQHAVVNNLLNPKYGENNPFAVHTEEQIKMACKLLQENHSYNYISALSGVNRKTLEGIKNGKKWKHISRNYNITKPVSSRWTSKIKSEIDNLINNGYKSKDIVKELDLPESNSTILWINRRIRKVKSSTTIP